MTDDAARCLELPEGFDDSDADGQVHPVGRRFFSATTNADVFARVQAWVAEHDVLVQDLAWEHLQDEDEPLQVTLYFFFDLPEPS